MEWRIVVAFFRSHRVSKNNFLHLTVQPTMSNDTTATAPRVELSKEEKKQRKEEKRAKKAAKAAAAAASADASANVSGETTPVVEDEAQVSEKKEKKDKKDRKDKKRKRQQGEDVEEPKEKKEKKAKESSDPASETVTSTSTEEPSSRKAQKKLAKAAAASSVATSSTSSKPLVTPTAFTSEHNTYLSTHNITLLPPLYPPHLSIPTLPIPDLLLGYLKKFPSPTPIQACSWPALLGGRDVVGIAETGSGKTLAFGVPALTHLHNLPTKDFQKGKGGKLKGNVNVLVLAPTRELAQQSHENLSLAGKSMGIESTCIFGGVPKDPQVRDLNRKEVRIVVGTPGRTLDLANQGDLDLSR